MHKTRHCAMHPAKGYCQTQWKTSLFDTLVESNIQFQFSLKREKTKETEASRGKKANTY